MSYPPQQPAYGAPAYAPPAYAPPAYPQPAYGTTPAPVIIVKQGGDNQSHVNVHGVTQSINMKCPKCEAQCNTRTKCEISQDQWMWCIIMCVLGIPCPCIPCYIPGCYRTHHHCERCNQYIGQSK